MRAVEKKISNIVKILMIILEAFFIIGGIIIVLLMSVAASLKKFQMVPPDGLTALFSLAFVVTMVMLLFLSVMVVISGILILRTIKKSSRSVSNAISKTVSDAKWASFNSSPLKKQLETNSFEKRVQSPFKITFGLMIGLVICVILELISIAIASIAADVEEVKLIWQGLNCIGVLIFGILIILLFYPLFMDSENALKEIESTQQVIESN